MVQITSTKLSKIIHIPLIEDEGYLCFAEGNKHLPFSIKRFYYISDVKKQAKRGYHAHKKTYQVLFCIKGSITVILDNGHTREAVKLDKPNEGLYLDTLMWHEMVDFTEDTVLLVAASETYKESDYIRDYGDFLNIVKEEQGQTRMYTNVFSAFKHALRGVI